MVNLPSGMVTFLFTDIEGSTQRWRHHEQVMQTAVNRHFDLLRGAIESHQGVYYTDVGDAIQAAFSTPRAAVAAALDAQRALLAESWPQEVAPFRVRMGLHTGEAFPHRERTPPTLPLHA